MAVRLEWKGGELLTKIRAAAPRAIGDVTTAAAAAARADHPGWQSRTGAGEASITAVAAQVHGTSVEGSVGFAIRPVLFQDRGFRSHPGDRALEHAVQREIQKLVQRLRDAIR